MTSNLSNQHLDSTLIKPKQPKQIGDFIIGKTLGSGTFGKVRLGTHIHTKQKVAIKFLQKQKIKQVADCQRVTRQIHILKLIRHPNLVQLYQIIQTPKKLLLIMEYMENGQLFDFIVKNKRIKQQQAIKLFHQLIDGIQYMHKIGIAHRDLKPQNILLNYTNSLKIVDFGLSNTYRPNQLLKTPCGSPCYAAPQMIKGLQYEGKKVDVWSSGIILFAMLNGYLPFEDEDTSALYQKVLSGSYQFHHSVSQQAKDLIKKILNNNPNQRYTIEKIRQHPWMAKYPGKKTHQGIIVGYNRIPYDQHIINQLSKYGNYDLEYVKTCIQANRHNQATVMYYLQMKKYLKSGGVSKYDLANDQFDKMVIQPPKRKDNTQILIDNFLNGNQFVGSTDITQQHNQKRKLRISKQKQQNKQNISIYMNRKKSKDKCERKSKDKSRDNIKLQLRQKQSKQFSRFNQHNVNTSQMVNSLTACRNNNKLNQSVQKKSDSQMRKLKIGLSTTKMERKPKSTKLDGSINYGRAPLTKSIQKNSGRQSQPHSISNNRQSINNRQSTNNRQSMIQNRVSRKYRQTFNQSLISKSKGKLKTHTQRQRQRSRINSSVNQSINQCSTNYQGFNTTNIANTSSGHAVMTLSKKYKDHDNSTGYIEQYLMKGKKLAQKKISSQNKQPNESSKIIKARKL